MPLNVTRIKKDASKCYYSQEKSFKIVTIVKKIEEKKHPIKCHCSKEKSL